MKYYYYFLGFNIESDLEFPFLEVRESFDEIDVRWKEETSKEFDKGFLEFSEMEPPLKLGNDVSYFENSYLRMKISHGNEILFCRKEKCSDIYARAFLMGFGMSILAYERDLIAIHGSVVVYQGRAYLISGESGSGKSTLTNQLLQRGYQFMVDDMTFVDSISDDKNAFAASAFPYQKLCRDAAIQAGFDLDELFYINEEKDKFLAPSIGEYISGTMPIGGMIYLVTSNTDEVMSQEVTGIGAFEIVSNNLFLRHLLRENKFMPQIGQKCLKMASKMPVYVIGRPKEGNTLEEVTKRAVSFIEGVN